ncbi:phage terminase large subunit, partial [Parabacteroides pacaensis]|uniref:phage terminase large subunit n=1 Tax=Parabacteroides pacaensis TaxID=2086575 RepID=UPI001F473F53
MIHPQTIYHPLYEDKEKFIILITGGRGSGKSFNASAFIERLTFEMTPIEKTVHQILYTRYTMVSAGMSIIPEMMEKIELDGTTKYFKTTKTDVVNRMTSSRIMFRGIKTSSGNQTAKLKSIHNITTFVCDEAEEWTFEVDFDKIMLSIRQKGIQNRIIIIMNPTDSNHFIYKKYIEKTHKLVEIDGVQVQISTHPNVLHIHTTYFDNIDNLSPQFLDEVRRMKEENPEKYAHTVIGSW